MGDNQLSELVIPEGSRQTLESLIAYGNKLKSLDLGGMNLDGCLLVAAGGGDPRPQTPVFEGTEQKDGSVVVDLSALADGLVEVDPGAGAYDATTHAVTFASAADAEGGFSYHFGTGAEVAGSSDDAVGVDDGILVVQASVDVKPYDDGSGDGGSSGDSDNDGAGGSDDPEDTDSDTGQAEGPDTSSNNGQAGGELSRTNGAAGAVSSVIGVVAVAAIAIVVAVIFLRRSRR